MQATPETTPAAQMRAKIEQLRRDARRDAMLFGNVYLLVRPDGIDRLDPARAPPSQEARCQVTKPRAPRATET